MKVPNGEHTVNVQERFSTFRLEQHPNGTLLGGIANEQGLYFGEQWVIHHTDNMNLNDGQTNRVLGQRPSDLGLAPDATLGEMVVQVMDRVLTGTLKLHVSLTINATQGGEPVPGAEWTVTDPAKENIYLASGWCNETIPNVAVFSSRRVTITAPGFQTLVFDNITLHEDAVYDLVMTPLP